MEKIILIWINIVIYRSQSNLILLRYDIDPKDKISKFCVEIIRDSRFTNSIERVSRSFSDEKWRKPIRISTYSQRIRLYTLRFLDISIIIKIFNHPSRWLFSLSLFLFVFVFTVTLQSSFENRLIFYIGIHALIIQRTWR